MMQGMADGVFVARLLTVVVVVLLGVSEGEGPLHGSPERGGRDDRWTRPSGCPPIRRTEIVEPELQGVRLSAVHIRHHLKVSKGGLRNSEMLEN